MSSGCSSHRKVARGIHINLFSITKLQKVTVFLVLLLYSFLVFKLQRAIIYVQDLDEYLCKNGLNTCVGSASAGKLKHELMKIQ